jgi:hypothetical protein
MNRQRHQACERQRADEAQRERVPGEEDVAARFAPAPLGDEIAASHREEKPVAVLDRLLQQLAAVVDREDLGPCLFGLDERMVKLVERQGVVEQRRVDHAARDRHLPRGYHVMTPSPGVRPARARAGSTARGRSRQ